MTDRSDVESLRSQCQRELLKNILPFWMTHGLDAEQGGVISSLDRNGSVIDTDKSIWVQGRFAWLLGELYNHIEPRDEWLQAAQNILQFVEWHGFDPADGRMWFQVTRDGWPLRKRRYAYSESFAAIAFGELAQATGEERYAKIAEKCFREFVQQSRQPVDPSPKFTNERPARSIGIPMITLVTAQELAQSIHLPDADEIIGNSIAEIRDDFCKPELNCVMETIAADGTCIDHFDGRTLNPGHAIEAAWFIMRAGERRKNQEWIDLGCQMLEWMWQRGWDGRYGGLMYFASLDDRPIQEYWQDMKFWLPHCEAIIACLLAFQLTGKRRYAEMFALVFDWTMKHFPDHEFGEWYGYLN
ncbi:MAG: AGE family epimerase/isomerase, partial [Pirellulaceae bacterium]